MAKVTFDMKALDTFIGKSKEKMEAVAKQAVVEAAARIQARTPVDTGFARAQWFPVINGRQTAETVTLATFTFDGMKLGDTIGIANNASYILKLEYGHSGQAPQGMVRPVAAEWDQIVMVEAQRVAAK